jgi:catechol 1,2-dioxygenase
MGAGRKTDDMRAGRTSLFLFGAILASAILLMPVFLPDEAGVLAAPACRPSPSDVEGPFYIPGAPTRISTGSGLVIRGRLLGAPDCRPLSGGRVEWWQTDRRGRYDDAHRGSQNVDSDGSYRFVTDFPGVYAGRPPHIHFKANATGYRTLTTQLYFRGGETEARFDIVLVPER